MIRKPDNQRVDRVSGGFGVAAPLPFVKLQTTRRAQSRRRRRISAHQRAARCRGRQQRASGMQIMLAGPSIAHACSRWRGGLPALQRRPRSNLCRPTAAAGCAPSPRAGSQPWPAAAQHAGLCSGSPVRPPVSCRSGRRQGGRCSAKASKAEEDVVADVEEAPEDQARSGPTAARYYLIQVVKICPARRWERG